MNVDAVDIQDFAKEEYSGFTLSEIEGENLLILGENRTGKTLSMNAILYNLLGPHHTIDLATGRGNNVELSFTNGIRFYRGASGAEYENGDILNAQKARDEFRDRLCDDPSIEVSSSDLIKTHFLHSRTEELPLSSYSKEARVDLIRSVVVQDVQEEIEYHTRADDQIGKLIDEKEAILAEKRSDLSDIKGEVNSAKRELENYENLFGIIQSGELTEINSRLQRQQELRDEISEIYQEKEGLRQERRTLNKEKNKWERYHENEVYEVIAEAVYDFVCPVCEQHIDTEKAENRLSSGYCPFCAERRDLSDLKANIRERIGGASDRLEEIKDRIQEIDERIDSLTDKENELKEDVPDLGNLDSFIERQLRQNGYSVEGLEEEAREEIERNQKSVEDGEARIEELEEEIEELDRCVEELESSQEVAKQAVEDLQDTSEDQLEEFQEKWEEEYQALADEIGLDIRLTPQGEIVLPGNTDDRTYDQDGDLSDAEMKLLNVSFSVTLNEFANDSEITKWSTLVLDEPFANLDSEGQENLMQYIKNKEQQFIVTTSDEELQGEFSEFTRLKRNTIQTTFNQFN